MSDSNDDIKTGKINFEGHQLELGEKLVQNNIVEMNTMIEQINKKLIDKITRYNSLVDKYNELNKNYENLNSLVRGHTHTSTSEVGDVAVDKLLDWGDILNTGTFLNSLASAAAVYINGKKCNKFYFLPLTPVVGGVFGSNFDISLDFKPKFVIPFFTQLKDSTQINGFKYSYNIRKYSFKSTYDLNIKFKTEGFYWRSSTKAGVLLGV